MKMKRARSCHLTAVRPNWVLDESYNDHWSVAGPVMRGLMVAVAAVCLVLGCRKGPRSVEENRELAPLSAPEVSIEGTPWEPVVEMQSELLDFFETGDSADEITAKAMKWRKENLSDFRQKCLRAKRYYAEDPERRINVVAKAGQAWSVVKERTGAISASWGAAYKRDVGILLNDFECR